MSNRFWTKKGLEDLGLLIRESRKNKKLSLRQVAKIVAQNLDSSCCIQAIDDGTLSRVERGYGEPKFNTLVAIAASGLITCDRRIPLTIYDFMDIASENFRVSAMDALARLIKLELQTRGWTLRVMSEECGVEFVDLFDISEGRESRDIKTDLILLSSVLTNPTTGESFGNAEDIIEFCGLSCLNNRG